MCALGANSGHLFLESHHAYFWTATRFHGHGLVYNCSLRGRNRFHGHGLLWNWSAEGHERRQRCYLQGKSFEGNPMCTKSTLNSSRSWPSYYLAA
jgi:hypothetical protein